MPGRSVPEAVDAFLTPLKDAVACLGTAHITLTPGARGDVGEHHMWTLNGGAGLRFAGGLTLVADMHFEVVDRGQSMRDERFKVRTLSYLYAVEDADRNEIISAHWHPDGKSDITFPHWHMGSVALSETGVFLERAHIPSPRVSLEQMVGMVLGSPGVEATRSDWRERLAESERLFDQHKSWGE